MPKIILKNFVRVSTISDFKTYYKTMGIKTVWYWPKSQQSLLRNSDIYDQLVFNKDPKTVQGKRQTFNSFWVIGFHKNKNKHLPITTITYKN